MYNAAAMMPAMSTKVSFVIIDINGIFSIIFEALYFLKLGQSFGLNLEAEIKY